MHKAIQALLALSSTEVDPDTVIQRRLESDRPFSIPSSLVSMRLRLVFAADRVFVAHGYETPLSLSGYVCCWRMVLSSGDSIVFADKKALVFF